MDYIKLQLVREIKNEQSTKRTKKDLRKELLIRMKKEIEEVEDYVLKIAYVNKDKRKPYIQIFTKSSYENYNQFRKNLE